MTLEHVQLEIEGLEELPSELDIVGAVWSLDMGRNKPHLPSFASSHWLTDASRDEVGSAIEEVESDVLAVGAAVRLPEN